MNLLQLPFTVPTMLQPPALNPAAVCESAARLLFMNVQWAKSMNSFTSLPLCDQLLLLEESWRELFVLGAAQFLPNVDLSMLISFSGALDHNLNSSSLLQNVQEFQKILSNLRQFQMDQQEFACLRAIILFKSTFEKPSSSSSPCLETKLLAEPTEVARIQDETQLTLNKYISTAYPEQPLRFGKLLLLLPTLRNISSGTIEDLFFRKTIGNIPIVRIICDVYKSQSNYP